MILDIEKTRLNNKMLISRDWNCRGIMASNINGYALY